MILTLVVITPDIKLLVNVIKLVKTQFDWDSINEEEVDPKYARVANSVPAKYPILVEKITEENFKKINKRIR